MSIVLYESKAPVAIASMYVCGNQHRSVITPFVRNARGEWEECGHHGFGSVTEAVVWAISEGRPIDNWEECVPELVIEDECRQEWERRHREEMVRQVLPAFPIMITYSGGRKSRLGR